MFEHFNSCSSDIVSGVNSKYLTEFIYVKFLLTMNLLLLLRDFRGI